MDAITKSLVDQVTCGHAWDLVEAFSTMPRWRPEDVEGAAHEIAKRLAALGVPVELLEADLALSIPLTASVTADGSTFHAKPPAYARSIPDGITGPLVYVPATASTSINTLFEKSQDAGLSSEDRIRGKIVVSEGFSFPGKILEFEAKGAIGVIAVNPGTDIHWGICTSIWGTPDLDDLPRKPKIPVASVNNPDGLRLIELAQVGGEATVRTELDEGTFHSLVPVVTVPGAMEPDDFVLLHGHYDSWDVGVGDNATGDAALLECARVLWENRADLSRSVRIAWWPGHSTGRYAGSTWFADRFALDLDRHCVAQINCDSPGCRWATEFTDVSWMKEAEAFCQDVIRDVTGLDSAGARPHRAGDYSFNNIGLTGFFMLSSTMPAALRAQKGYYVVGGCGGNIAWHTENDTMEIADRDILERDIKVYLAATVEVANAKILPFDWRATVADFTDVIAGYQSDAGDLADFTAAAQATAHLAKKLDAFHAALDTVDPKVANRTICRLARILVPLNHSTGPRFRHDPALPVLPLPTLAVARGLHDHGPETLVFAQTQAVRGCNRVTAALWDAIDVVDAAL